MVCKVSRKDYHTKPASSLPSVLPIGMLTLIQCRIPSPYTPLPVGSSPSFQHIHRTGSKLDGQSLGGLSERGPTGS